MGIGNCKYPGPSHELLPLTTPHGDRKP